MAEIGSVQLGDRVKAKVNGFAGIVTVVADHLYGCRQVYIRPETLDKDKKERPGVWMDEPWVDVIKAGVHSPRAAISVLGRKKLRAAGPESAQPPTDSRMPD